MRRIHNKSWIGLMAFMSLCIPQVQTLGQTTPIVIHDSKAFFPHHIGNTWHYQGRINNETMHFVANTTFSNVSTITGHKTLEGVKALVFHDSNPGGDKTPIESYYVVDAAGIRYYGSKPGSMLEKQLVPYQIVRFPLEIPSAFQPMNREQVNLGRDLDRDGEAEQVDVRSTITIQRQESVTVPLGTYPDAIRLHTHMDLYIHLSRDGQQVKGYDEITFWLVKDLGLVKYVERQMVPMLGTGLGRIIEITEELEKVHLVE